MQQATFKGVKSGEIDVALNIKSEGKEGGTMKVALSGPFQSTGLKSLPELGMTATADGEANGEKIDFEGGLTVLNDRAYVGYDGNQYEVDPTTFGFIKSGFEKSEQEGEGESKGAEANACQKAATSLDLSEFVDNLENEGGEEVDGVKTTKLSGDLNPQKAVAAAIKKAHAEIYVGEDDHIVRKVVADFTIEPKGSGEKVETELEVTLSKVNEKVAIKAPAGAKPLTDLFGELGISLNQLGGLLEGGGTEGIGGLLEGLMSGSGLGGGSSSGGGESSSGGGAEEAELPLSPEFTECLEEAKGAAELQKCASLME